MACHLRSFMNDVFAFIEKLYSLQTASHLRLMIIHKTKYGIETLSYFGSKLWNLVPNEYETIESLATFLTKNKTWIPENCPCRFCKA